MSKKRSLNENKPRFSRFISSMERYGFGDPVTSFLKAAESINKCEKMHRKAERAKLLKLPKADYYEEMAMLSNRQSLRKLQLTKKSLKKAIKMYPEIEKECDLLPDKEKGEILSDCDLMFKDELFEMDLSPEILIEIWAEYENVRKVIDNKGMRGLLTFSKSKADELIEARTDLEKGRQPASPLAVAAMIAVAFLLGVAIGAVIDCYAKMGCQWIEDALKSLRCGLQATTVGAVSQECHDKYGWEDWPVFGS
jgi:hypothetical protein